MNENNEVGNNERGDENKRMRVETTSLQKMKVLEI
jgi:hypothetical protein